MLHPSIAEEGHGCNIRAFQKGTELAQVFQLAMKPSCVSDA